MPPGFERQTSFGSDLREKQPINTISSQKMKLKLEQMAYLKAFIFASFTAAEVTAGESNNLTVADWRQSLLLLSMLSSITFVT